MNVNVLPLGPVTYVYGSSFSCSPRHPPCCVCVQADIGSGAGGSSGALDVGDVYGSGEPANEPNGEEKEPHSAV